MYASKMIYLWLFRPIVHQGLEATVFKTVVPKVSGPKFLLLSFYYNNAKRDVPLCLDMNTF